MEMQLKYFGNQFSQVSQVSDTGEEDGHEKADVTRRRRDKRRIDSRW